MNNHEKRGGAYLRNEYAGQSVPTKDRPALYELLRELDRGVIVIETSDRLSRDCIEWSEAEEFER
jgi:DNA invertase Pin-like site-specific DNA recombinase